MLPPTLLIPGLKSDRRVWQPQIEALRSLTEVIVPTSALGADSVSGMAERILAEAPPRFALAGCSMGGYVALEIVRTAAERATRLALLSTSARPEQPAATERRRAALELARREGVDAMALAGLDRDFFAAHRRDPRLGALMAAMAREVGLATVERQMRAVIGRRDFRPGLAAIACPTVIVCGENDVVTSPDCARELAEAIRGASLHLIPDCGHCATLEAPDAVNALLRDWLQS